MSRVARFFPVVFLACGGAPLRTIPAADWARGSEAFVVKSTSTNPPRPQEKPQALLKSGVEEDLRAAGISVLAAERGKGELVVLLGDWGAELPFFGIEVRVQRSGQEIERFAINPEKLACWASFGGDVYESNLRCVGREIAAHILESRPVAEAMRRAPPAPAAVASQAPVLSGKLAVLELRNFAKDLTRETAQYFTDVVRSAALKAQPQLQIMTRENLLVLLKASGKSLDECEGECEVDTGRRIGADEIVSGEILRVGTMYKITLRLHDTREGRLLSSTQASGKTIDELDANAQKAAADLLSGR